VYQKIIIVSGGVLDDPVFFHKKMKEMEDGMIICCDGGARHFQNSAIRPHVIIGDMDSIDAAQLADYSAEKTEIIKHPPDKNFSDTELALDYALNLNPQEIFIWCALGGRIDHTLSNVFLLCRGHEKGIRTFLVDEYCESFVLDKKVTFINEKGKTVSLLAMTPEVTGINLSGFLYPLENGALKMGESRGISNVINEARAVISAAEGILFVVKYRRKNSFPEAL